MHGHVHSLIITADGACERMKISATQSKEYPLWLHTIEHRVETVLKQPCDPCRAGNTDDSHTDWAVCSVVLGVCQPLTGSDSSEIQLQLSLPGDENLSGLPTAEGPQGFRHVH